MSSFLCSAGQGACMRRYKCQHFIDGIYAADRSHAGLHKVRGFGDECTDFKEVESARLLRELVGAVKRLFDSDLAVDKAFEEAAMQLPWVTLSNNAGWIIAMRDLMAEKKQPAIDQAHALLTQIQKLEGGGE